MQFEPNVQLTVNNGVITVTDISNYDNNDEGYSKSEVTLRTVTVSDGLVGLNSVTKPLSYGNDSQNFDLSLISLVVVRVSLAINGNRSGFNFSKDFIKYLNV